MNWRAVLAYRPSESTIVGVATIVGCAVGIARHELPVSAALPVLAGALTAVILPGNGAAAAVAQKAARDVIAAQQPGASSMVAAQMIGGDVLALERAAGQPQP